MNPAKKAHELCLFETLTFRIVFSAKKFHSISGGFHGFLSGFYGVFTAFSRYVDRHCFLNAWRELDLAIFGRCGHPGSCVDRVGHTS